MRYRTTMRIIMFYNFVGLVLIILAGIFRFRIKGDLGAENKEIDKEKDDEEKREKEEIEDEMKNDTEDKNNVLLENKSE